MIKQLPQEAFDNAKYAASLKKATTEELYLKIKELADVTASQVERMAIIAHELEERGENLAVIKAGLGSYLKAVYARRLHPKAVVQLAGNQAVLGAISQVPVEVQEKLLDRGTVAVLEGDGVKEKKIHLLTKNEADRVFDPINRCVRPPEEQTAPKPRGEADMPRTWPITFRLNEDEFKAFQGYAERSKRSIQVLVIETLRNAKLLKAA